MCLAAIQQCSRHKRCWLEDGRMIIRNFVGCQHKGTMSRILSETLKDKLALRMQLMSFTE